MREIIDLPHGYDCLDVIVQLKAWQAALHSKRFDVMSDEAINEIIFGRMYRPHCDAPMPPDPIQALAAPTRTPDAA